MIARDSPPNDAPSPAFTIVRAAAKSIDARLYGRSTGMTDSTPGSERSGMFSRSASSPMHPTIVLRSPRERCVLSPAASMRSRIWSSSASVMFARVTMIIVDPCENKKARVSTGPSKCCVEVLRNCFSHACTIAQDPFCGPRNSRRRNRVSWALHLTLWCRHSICQGKYSIWGFQCAWAW